MQIWLLACTLNIWQVNTICPVSPSADDGAGIDIVSLVDVIAMGVEVDVTKLKSGVADASTGIEVEAVSGVEACSVANRSGVGVEAAGRLHPAIKERKIKSVGKSLNLFKVHFDGFNMEFLTGQNLCAITSTVGAMDDSVFGMIFFEAGHTLDFGGNGVKVKPCIFCNGIFC